MNNETERERTLKVMANDEEWAEFMEAIPRDWRKRFAKLAQCVKVDVQDRPRDRRGVSYPWHTLQDRRANSPAAYRTKHRRGQLLRSWDLGVNHRKDGGKAVSFTHGLTWGSIGQILGYLLGEIPDQEKRDYYERLLAAYLGTDQGAPLRGEINTK